MGNLLCQFRTWLRRCRPHRGAPLGRHPLVLPSREAAQSDREHPAAPAPAFCPGRRLCHRHRSPLSPALYIAPRRRSTRQARYKALRVLLLVNWRDSPEKPVLAAFISMTFGHSRAIRIPPRRLQFTLLHSPPEQVVKVRKLVPSSHLPLPSPKEREVKVQEEPRRGMAKMEDHTETEGEDDRKRGHRSSGDIPLTSRPQEASGVLTSLKRNPEPLDLLPEQPEDNWSENAQVSPVSPSSESHVTRSDGDPGDVLLPWKPESHAMVLCVPAACRCPLLVRPKNEVLGEDHRLQSTGSPMSGKELQRETSSQIPARSSSSLASASSRPCKRKIPLTRDCAERLPPPKLPCLAAAKNPGTWLQRISCPCSQNCLPETGLISGLPLIVPHLFSLRCHNRFYMGSLLCNLRTWPRQCWPRRGVPLDRHPLVLTSREAAPSDWEHPAFPAPAICPGRRLSHQYRSPLSPALYIAPRRRSTRQARYKALSVLILVNRRDSPKKPVLAAFISMTFSHSRAIRIPPRRLQFTLLRSPPEQVVKVRKLVPSSHLPLPSPKEREVKVQEEPRRGMAKMEDHTETEGEDDRKRGHRSSGDIPLTSRPQEASGVLTSLKRNPEPLDLLPEQPEDNWSENAQVSPVSPSSESHVTRSDGDPGDVLLPWKPESHAMVLCVPAACRCPLLVRPKNEVLGEDHRLQSTGSPMSGKELQRETSSQIPARSSSSLASASSRPCKRKIPLTRDCGDELKCPYRRDNRWCEPQILSRPAVAGGSCGSRSGAEGAEERHSVHSAEAVGVKSSRTSLGEAHTAGRATESCNAQGSHSSEGSRPRCRGTASPSDHGPSAASGTLAADTMPTPAWGPRLATRPRSVHSTRVAARRRRDMAPS